MKSILPRSKRNPRILVIGDVMLDRYTWGSVDRVSPEAPIPVLSSDQEEVRPGGAASVAMLASHLEADVTLLGVVGQDPEASVLLRVLAEHRVCSKHVLQLADRPTTCKHRYIGRAAGRHPHQMLRVDRESTVPIGSEDANELLASFDAEVANCQAVLVADYAKGVCTQELVGNVVARCRRIPVPVLVDPARGVVGENYRGATLLTPNRMEAGLLAAENISTPVDAVRVATNLKRDLDIQTVIVTLDREGLVLVGHDQAEHLPTTPRDVYDITGAGDMVLAMCGYGYAVGLTIQETVKLANAAAGLQVERFGVEPVSWGEIEGQLSRSTSHKICGLQEIAAFAATARRDGQRVVFTNGCFDLFHAGHLRTIDEAASQGDVLIVAVNSDTSVRRLKGEGRPVIAAEQRAQVLAAIESVDRVVIFDETTPHELLRSIRPDVLVKGGSTNEIVGCEVVESYGGRIHRTALLPQLSTTGILATLKEAETKGIAE